MAAQTNSEYISDLTQRRLIHDISDMYKNPLSKQGIYYIHDDEHMLKGYAMIIGPPGSVYEHGFYFFEFTFPYNYPQCPPRLKYMTNDGVTRFHPNLYRGGKVCLSILNTWKGEGWTSCQTIKSILLTIISILDEKPMLNEPGITEKNPDVTLFNELISYKNIQFSFLEMASNRAIPGKFKGFMTYINDYAKTHKEEIITFAEKRAIANTEPKQICIHMYKTQVVVDWTTLYNNLVKFYT